MPSVINVEAPYSVFTDREGDPLEDGNIYIGTYGLNPLIEANRVAVYADSGLTIPVAQPVKTLGGLMVRSGTPMHVFASGLSYSIVITDKNGALVYSDLFAQAFTYVNWANITYDRTAYEIAAGVTPVATQYAPDHVGLDVRREGAIGDGATNDRTALFNANAVGSMMYLPRGLYKVSSNLTITVPMLFDYGAILVPDAGVTITINAPIVAGAWQIFNANAAGAVITGKIRVDHLLVEWWGAVGDGVTNDSTLTQKTFKAAADAGFIPIQLFAKDYKWDSQVFGCGSNTPAVDGVPLYGVPGAPNSIRTRIICSGLGVGVSALKYRAISGAICTAQVRDIFFDGDADTILLEFAGMINMRAVRCCFGTSAEGLRFHNEDVGHFTEFCMADQCDFQIDCTKPIRYMRTAGSNSFHGSGCINRNTLNITAGAFITVDVGCFPYNSPIDVQVWNWNAATVVASAAITPLASFFGTITFEIFGPGALTMGSGQQIGFVGTVQGIGATAGTGANVLGGTLLRCKAISINTDSSMTITGYERAGFTDMNTGATTIASFVAGQFRLYRVFLTAAGYIWDALVSVSQSGSGALTTAKIVVTNELFNVSGYGAPTVSTDVNGNLIITNAGFPAATVIAQWAEMSLDSGPFGATRLRF